MNSKQNARQTTHIKSDFLYKRDNSDRKSVMLCLIEGVASLSVCYHTGLGGWCLKIFTAEKIQDLYCQISPFLLLDLTFLVRKKNRNSKNIFTENIEITLVKNDILRLKFSVK